MASYLLIESRDPFESNDVPRFYELAASLARAENDVTLFLIQNGVLAARARETGSPFADLGRSGVKVLADDFSLRERGIPAARLSPGVAPATVDVIVDRLAAGVAALWH
jgi:sulfur relay (sulfurtransferase) complex TusBCD TusD component (DsrE family)